MMGHGCLQPPAAAKGAWNGPQRTRAWIYVRKKLQKKRYDIVPMEAGYSGALFVVDRVPRVARGCEIIGSGARGGTTPSYLHRYPGHLVLIKGRAARNGGC